MSGADENEVLAVGYAKLSGKPFHWSSCATSNAPAMKPGPCDCLSPALPMNSVPKNAGPVLVYGGTYTDETETFPTPRPWFGWALVDWDDSAGEWRGEQQAHDQWLWHQPEAWHPLPVLAHRQENEQ